MTRLRLHQELYSVRGIDAAIAAYEQAGTFARAEHAPYFELQITAAADVDEAELASELANYALASTIEERRSGRP